MTKARGPATAGHYFSTAIGLVLATALAAGAGTDPAGRTATLVSADAGSHVQGRGQLRRRGRARGRQRRELRPWAEAGRFSGARGRQAAEGAGVRHGRHSEHAAAQTDVSRSERAADRTGRRGQQAGPRRPSLSDRPRRLSRGAAAQPERPSTRTAVRAREARPGRSGGRRRHQRPDARRRRTSRRTGAC